MTLINEENPDILSHQFRIALGSFCQCKRATVGVDAREIPW